MNFNEILLNENIIQALKLENITTPTPIQEKIIPNFTNYGNVIIQSQTGSGKTYSYLLPIYQSLAEKQEKNVQVLIVLPTRELCMQVHNQVQILSKNSGLGLKSVAIFGNANIQNQIEKLKEKPQIVIGTTDRILELINKKKLSVHNVKHLIVDEADKLLDEKNIISLLNIKKKLLRDVKITLVSAFFNAKSLDNVNQISNNFELLKIEENLIPDTITHLFLVCDSRNKLENLRKIIAIEKSNKNLVFINKLNEINVAVDKLNYHKLTCNGIHSDTLKEERKRQLENFKNGKFKVLVCTDVASRGLQINNIEYVFSLTISENPIDYLHRCGRTGRNGNKGTSICFVTKNELKYITKYSNKFNIKFKEIKLKNGQVNTIDNI